MSKLSISLACGGYDRTRALFTGEVEIDGCEAICLAMPPEEAFHRAFKYGEFDVTELSMSGYMVQVAAGSCAYVGIPVFPSRLFRHSSIYVRADRGIDDATDLRGRVVGVPEYHMTAALWVRGILQDEYGVAPRDMRWRTGGLETAGRGQFVSTTAIPGVEIEPIAVTETLSDLLDRGEIDALVSARPPSCLARNDKVRRLFPDYRAAEAAYYAKTGLFPIMHLVGIRRTLLERHPWLAVNVLKAFVAAKARCYSELESIGSLYVTLPWPADELRQVRALMGSDFWPYGVDANRGEIAAMTRYAHQQGLTSRQLSDADLFAPSCLDLAKV